MGPFSPARGREKGARRFYLSLQRSGREGARSPRLRGDWEVRAGAQKQRGRPITDRPFDAIGSGGRIRTYDPAVNSRLLYH